MTRRSDSFNKLKSRLSEIYKNAEFGPSEWEHALDTLRWTEIIDTNADETLKIAALAHDIDRAVPPRIRRNENETYDDYKVRHSRRSAQLISELMVEYGFPKESIERTYHLVNKHELGGDKGSNIIKDADSISFFSNNIEWYYNYKKKNYYEVKREIRYKYERATPRAKRLIKTINIKNKVLRDICKEIFI